MSYNKPTIPKGTRYSHPVSVPYSYNYQQLTQNNNNPIGLLNPVKFAENWRLYGSFW